MGNYLTVIKTKRKPNKNNFLKFAEKHWKELQIEESFSECEDMCVEIFDTIVEKRYASDYAGSIEGGILRLMEDYLTTNENKTIVNHEEFNSEDQILVIT